MDVPEKLPFYGKAALLFISMISFVFILYAGQHIIIPIICGAIVAILLNPLMVFLMLKGMHQVIAICIWSTVFFIKEPPKREGIS